MLIIYYCFNYLILYNNSKNIIYFIIYLFNYNKWKKDYFSKKIMNYNICLFFIQNEKKNLIIV